MKKISICSGVREQMIPVADKLHNVVVEQGWSFGLLLVHCPHTTAGLTINESADPAVRDDMCEHLNKLVPQLASFKHYEGNSDAHIKSSLMGCQLLLIVENGRLALGQWQEVYFCEWDGPRSRELWLQFLPSE